jgi:polar amino acid transport system permease protein/cystine transport system permease protein
MPQAVRFALPLLGNQFILTIKESAIASIITVPELTMTTSQIVANTYSYILPYTLLIISYWLLAQGQPERKNTESCTTNRRIT